MIFVPGMLMIGAANRNVGKTRFACSLIEKFGSQSKLVGIKVTSMDDGSDRRCHRGVPGCNACARVAGKYEILEETDHLSNKDTGKMLACGADRVFWLRCERMHLLEGLAAVQEMVGGEAVSICESNSLRNFVEPDVFIVVARVGDVDWKDSAQAVGHYADRIVEFDGKEFDFGVDQIQLRRGRWACQMGATAVIMAGGASRRMGQDKSMLRVDGRPVIQHVYDKIQPHFEQISVSTNCPEKHAFLRAEIICDKALGQGPLMGIFSALERSESEVNFVVACDIPQIDIRLVKRMIRERDGADIVLPRYGDGRIEPLFGIYCKSALDAMGRTLAAGKRKIADAFGLCRVKYVDLDEGRRLRNLNTMAEYIEFAKEYNADAGGSD
jgi:molybdopterin-guanine dinucleotide biosynthesis protein A